MRMEPYILYRLTVENLNACTDKIKKVITNIDRFLEVLAQSYGDLNEIRTSKLQLIELK